MAGAGHVAAGGPTDRQAARAPHPALGEVAPAGHGLRDRLSEPVQVMRRPDNRLCVRCGRPKAEEAQDDDDASQHQSLLVVEVTPRTVDLPLSSYVVHSTACTCMHRNTVQERNIVAQRARSHGKSAFLPTQPRHHTHRVQITRGGHTIHGSE